MSNPSIATPRLDATAGPLDHLAYARSTPSSADPFARDGVRVVAVGRRDSTAKPPDDGQTLAMKVRRSRAPWLFYLGMLVAASFVYFVLATAFVSRAIPLLAGWDTSAIISGSMAPSLLPGDIVAFKRYDGSPLHPGTIISFDDPSRPGTLTAHRIVSAAPDGSFITKGDANAAPDSSPVRAEMVRGVARLVAPNGALPLYWWRTHQLSPLLGFATTTLAAIFVLNLRDPAERRLLRRPGRQARSRLARAVIVVPTVGVVATLALVGVTLASFGDLADNSTNAFAAASSFGPEPPSSLMATPMCAPDTIIFLASASNGGDAASVSLGRPTGVAVGDVLIAAFLTRNVTTVNQAPAGWSLLTTIGSMRVYHRIAGESEPITYTWTLGSQQRWAGGIAAYRGAAANPIDAVAASSSSGTPSLLAPSVTTSVDQTMLIALFGSHHRGAITEPNGMTERWDLSDGGQGGPTQGVRSEAADEAFGSAGATGGRIATAGGAVLGYGVLVAIAPDSLVAAVVLDWLPTPTGTADGYALERWVGGFFDAGWTVNGATATSFSDETAVEGLAYTYRIRTIEGTEESAPIEIAIVPSCGD
ncbi:MAG: signal peptidase I [Acidimicrobiia bacterium]